MIKIFRMPSLVCRGGFTLWPVPEDNNSALLHSLIKGQGLRPCPFFLNHMTAADRKAGLLSPYRVLDLSNELGFLCGKILGDLGADVVKIEPPGGEPARRLGPFYGGQADPEKSLFWFGFNNNKRGITLNLESARGRELFAELVAKADFVI